MKLTSFIKVLFLHEVEKLH